MVVTKHHIVVLNPLHPLVFAAHLLRLSPAHRTDRFGSAVCDPFLKQYADRTAEMGTFVMGCLCDDSLRAVVELRPFDPAAPTEAEAAFSVEGPWQSQGLGTALMSHAIAVAPALGICNLIVCRASRNTRMRRIAQRYGGNVVDDQGDCIATIAVETTNAAH